MPDAMSVPGLTAESAAPTIVIIGGGFSGTVTAIKLLDGATEPLTILVILTPADLVVAPGRAALSARCRAYCRCCL